MRQHEAIICKSNRAHFLDIYRPRIGRDSQALLICSDCREIAPDGSFRLAGEWWKVFSSSLLLESCNNRIAVHFPLRTTTSSAPFRVWDFLASCEHCKLLHDCITSADPLQPCFQWHLHTISENIKGSCAMNHAIVKHLWSERLLNTFCNLFFHKKNINKCLIQENWKAFQWKLFLSRPLQCIKTFLLS